MTYTASLSTMHHFSKPFTGTELRMVVQRVTMELGTHFADTIDPNYPQRLLFGQMAEDASGHMIVVDPDQLDAGLLPDVSYEMLVVRAKTWPNAVASLSGCGAVTALQSLLAFSAKLEEVINGLHS